MRWRVERARLDRDIVRLDVAGRERRLTYLAPFDRVVPLDRRRPPRKVRRQHAAARICASIAASFDSRAIASITGARVDVLPHQLEPALALLAGTRRILIADEVGLGKTIQAGMAIAEVVARCAAGRVLVIVPAALRDQWAAEMCTRFSIDVVAADRTSLDRAGRIGPRGDDPWRRSGVWIATADYLKQPHVFGGLPLVPWDLVVIDEAHDVCGASDRHDACDEISRRARRVLLLTATPHSGDAARFDRLCRLGEHDAPVDELTVFRRTRAVLGNRPPRHLRWHGVPLAIPEIQLLDALGAFERRVLDRASIAQRDTVCLLLSVFRKRALSTTAALLRSLDRRLAWLEDPAHPDEGDWHQPSLAFTDERDVFDEDERAGLFAATGLARAQELAWLRRLRALALSAARHESKVARLVSLTRRSVDPLIVFTEFRDSLEYLRRRLDTSRVVAAIHGGLSPLDRRLELDRFLTGAASVLLATDVAGQGLNLQTRARWVVSLELPWNPARLEQRIGRVDRIGQQRTVHATILIARHAAEHGLLARLARRALTAQHALASDVLPIAAPAIAALVPALAAGALDFAAAETSASPPKRNSRRRRVEGRWARLARRVAAATCARRAFAMRWRAPLPVTEPAVWSHLTAAQLEACDAILLFSVPIVEGSGLVVERHAVPIRVTETSVGIGRREDLVDAAAVVAARHLERRVRRIAAARLRALPRAIAVEAALASHLHAITRPDRAEPGLFDRRVVRAFESAQSHDADLSTDAQAWTSGARERAEVRVGSAVLDVLLERRR